MILNFYSKFKGGKIILSKIILRMNDVRPICTSGATQQKPDSGTSCYYEPSGKTNRYSESTMTKSRLILYSIYCCENVHYLVLFLHRIRSGIWKTKIQEWQPWLHLEGKPKFRNSKADAFNFQMRYQLLLAWPFIFSSFWCGRKCIHCGRGFA